MYEENKVGKPFSLSDFEKIMYDDKRSTKLGEILANPTAKEIIEFMQEKEVYLNEIVTGLNYSTDRILTHLRKLVELEIVETFEKRISKRTKMHKYYRLRKNFIIITSFNNSKNEIDAKKIWHENSDNDKNPHNNYWI